MPTNFVIYKNSIKKQSHILFQVCLRNYIFWNIFSHSFIYKRSFYMNIKYYISTESMYILNNSIRVKI